MRFITVTFRTFVATALVALFLTTAQAQEEAEPLNEKDRLIRDQKIQLKKAKRKINELEEKLYIATDGKETDTVDPNIGEAGDQPWLENARRLPMGTLFPLTGTIAKGEFFARFAHIGQEQTFTYDNNAFHDFVGIESNVKIGVMFGYGIADGWDITLQRTNGQDRVAFDDGKYYDYDAWDLMTKIKILDEKKHWIDVSLLGGATYLWQNNDHGKVAGNAGLLFAKSFGRLRVGTGVLYTSISTFESTYSSQDDVFPTKRHPREVEGSPEYQSDGNNHTVAVPVSLAYSFTPHCELFAEGAFPTDGFETKGGPSAAAGLRYNTNSHSYSLFFTNTSNNSFNSTFTGGYKSDRLDIFGFTISIFF